MEGDTHGGKKMSERRSREKGESGRRKGRRRRGRMEE